jgi:hypothetical protein
MKLYQVRSAGNCEFHQDPANLVFAHATSSIQKEGPAIYMERKNWAVCSNARATWATVMRSNLPVSKVMGRTRMFTSRVAKLKRHLKQASDLTSC